MALPTSRDVTFAPGSQVPSATLNDLQDQIIANNARLNGDATKPAVVLGNAMTAPDYHFTVPRPRMFVAASGFAATGTWVQAGNLVVSATAGVAEWIIPVVVESGETIVPRVQLQMGTAVSGGQIFIYRGDAAGGSPVLVSTTAIASSTAFQNIAIASHAVVTSCAYWADISFPSGAGTKEIFAVELGVTR